MANVKAKALAKNRKPAQLDEKTDEEIKAELDADREIDYSRPEVNANTDDEGNPIAVKDKISLAPQKTKQMQEDFEAYQKGQARRKAMAERAKAKK